MGNLLLSPAQVAYEKAAQGALDRLLAISHHIETERELARDATVNWGQSGDLLHASALLDDIATFLGIENKKGTP